MVIYKFSVGDVDDPDLWIAPVIYEWQESEMGRWVMENAIKTPMWHREHNVATLGYHYAVTADFKPEDEVYFHLRWGDEITKR